MALDRGRGARAGVRGPEFGRGDATVKVAPPQHLIKRHTDRNGSTLGISTASSVAVFSCVVGACVSPR